MIIAVSLVVCIVGLLLHLIASQPKLQTIGLYMFWVGLLVSLLRWTSNIFVH